MSNNTKISFLCGYTTKGENGQSPVMWVYKIITIAHKIERKFELKNIFKIKLLRKVNFPLKAIPIYYTEEKNTIIFIFYRTGPTFECAEILFFILEPLSLNMKNRGSVEEPSHLQ